MNWNRVYSIQILLVLTVSVFGVKEAVACESTAARKAAKTAVDACTERAGKCAETDCTADSNSAKACNSALGGLTRSIGQGMGIDGRVNSGHANNTQNQARNCNNSVRQECTNGQGEANQKCEEAERKLQDLLSKAKSDMQKGPPQTNGCFQSGSDGITAHSEMKKAKDNAQMACNTQAAQNQAQTSDTGGNMGDASKIAEMAQQMLQKAQEGKGKQEMAEEKEDPPSNDEGSLKLAEGPPKATRDPQNQTAAFGKTRAGKGQLNLANEKQMSPEEEFKRELLGCDPGESMAACCARPENARSCTEEEPAQVASQQGLGVGGAGGGGRQSAGLDGGGGSRQPAATGKAEVKSRPSLPNLNSASVGGGGGGKKSGGHKPYRSRYQSKKKKKAKKRPTLPQPQKLAALMSQQKEIAGPGRDNFGAVTRKMRKIYMDGKLIQTQGVLFLKAY